MPAGCVEFTLFVLGCGFWLIHYIPFLLETESVLFQNSKRLVAMFPKLPVLIHKTHSKYNDCAMQYIVVNYVMKRLIQIAIVVFRKCFGSYMSQNSMETRQAVT